MTDRPDDVHYRIERARHKASESERSPWYVGRSPYLHCDVYMVRSAKGEWMYYQEVYNTTRHGGYNYSLEATQARYIRCTCDSYKVHGKPCHHAALIELYLERTEQLREQDDLPF